jgi:hypothetical protein
MAGTIPGFLGVAAFAGIKFAGYCLAGTALKKLYPAVTAGAAKIAAVRTGLGLLLGPLVSLFGGLAMELLLPNMAKSHASLYLLYVFLGVVRILVWALVIFIFTKQTDLPKSRLWIYAFVGAVWSCLLDWPGFKLAMIAPGQIPVC